MKNSVKIFLEDMTFNTSYHMLETGKDDDELKNIAEKRGITLPSPDIAVFKGRYALTGVENKNKCTLPKEEVEKALNTLVGKAVDIDHLRKRSVGWWLESYLDDGEIISYGAFWKSNFEEEYEDFKNKMEEGKVKISFEAWGDREYTNKEQSSFNLVNIHFAGGALLKNTTPAEPTAEVLEFAKVIEQGESDLNEDYRAFYSYDFENIMMVLSRVICPECSADYSYIVDVIDFKAGKSNGQCCMCQAKLNVDFLPKVEIGKQRIKTITIDSNFKGGIQMDEKMKEMEKELASLKTQLETTTKEKEVLQSELEQSKQVLDELKKESEEAKAKIDEIQTAKAEEIEKAKTEATLIAERKAELGEAYATDVDLLDDTKYELAKTKKQLEEAKSQLEKVKAGEVSVENTITTASDISTEEQKTRDNIKKFAFGE